MVFSSPISNTYFPVQEDEFRLPSPKLRELEVNFNKIFSLYAKQYYSNPVTSVYASDIGEKTIEDGFTIAILIKNSNI